MQNNILLDRIVNPGTGPLPRTNTISNAMGRRSSHLSISIILLALLTVAGIGFFATSVQAEDVDYTVQPGDNPWNITERYLKSINYWPRIQQYNHIQDPERIPPGTVLRIPLSWMRTEELKARILDLRGEVTIDQDHETLALQPGMTVHPGALIRTGVDSSFTLVFPDGTRSLINANTEVRLIQLLRVKGSGGQQVEFDLRNGQIENSVQSKRRNGDRYLIRTPAAVAAVRGTEFRAVAGADRAQVETLTGEVALGNRRGQVRLPAGVGSIAERDQRPEQATPLPAPPDLSGLPERVERLPVDLPIPPVEGAVGYRSQFALSEDFTVLESDRTASRPAVLGRAELPDGHYLLRVRARDERGLEGHNAERTIVIDARPEPPFPLNPHPDGVASEERISFNWAVNPRAIQYHFELADNSHFEGPILREDALQKPALELETALDPGTYYWRVAVTTTDEGRGPFSDPQRFRRPPPGPVPETSIEGKQLELRWRANEANILYQVQLSKSAEFMTPEFEYETNEPHLAIDKPFPAVYHIRIRGIEADGSVSPWGRPQIVEVPANYWPVVLIFLPLLFLL